jgi:hypothetical protein
MKTLIALLLLCVTVEAASTNYIPIPWYGVTTDRTNFYIDTNRVLLARWWDTNSAYWNNFDTTTNAVRTNLARFLLGNPVYLTNDFLHVSTNGIIGSNTLWSVLLWQFEQAQDYMNSNYDRSIFTRAVTSNGLTMNTYFTNTGGRVSTYSFLFSDAPGVATPVDVRVMVDDDANGTWDYSARYGVPISLTGTGTNFLTTPDVSPGAILLVTNLSSGATVNGISTIRVQK